MSDSLNVLNETFELYFKKAEQSSKDGNKQLAKKYYMLAAEQMLKMAKESSGKLREARFKKARSLVESAENLDGGTEKDTADEENVSVTEEDVSLEAALDSLNSLVGLESVKKKVSDWADQIKIFELRSRRGLPVPEMSYHLVFTGNPGTGKTTVARLIAKVYRALGVLEKGHLVEVDRSGLVAGYIGQTAAKTKAVIKKARGGVLFIDEAYSLVGGGENDFGSEAVDALIKEMEDNRGNLAVIVAGYEKEMEKFVRSNPGLRSRFKTFIEFPDYNGEELFSIFMRLCAKDSYNTDAAAEKKLRSYFDGLYENRGESFGNGREVRNFYESVVTRQSGRVAKLENPTDEQLMNITDSDLGL